MSETLMYPFPSLSALRGEFPDHAHQLDEATYVHAKRLYETRKCATLSDRTTDSVKYHVRECVQLALCEAYTQRESLKPKQLKYDDARRP